MGIKDWTLDPQVTYGPKLSPITKPKFSKVNKLNPLSKGMNLYLKVIKAPEGIEGSSDVKEVLVGDDTGVVMLSIREASQVAACTVGELIKVQDGQVKMIKGFIRVVVDKWGVLKAGVDAATAGFEAVDEKTNMSATEYELVDK